MTPAAGPVRTASRSPGPAVEEPSSAPVPPPTRVRRVDDARGVPAGEVRALVEAATAGHDPGFVGAPHVRVLALDLALDREIGPV